MTTGLPTVVADTNVLVNLATAVVDDSKTAPSGADPLRTLVGAYDVHVPERVVGELYETRTGGTCSRTRRHS